MPFPPRNQHAHHASSSVKAYRYPSSLSLAPLTTNHTLTQPFTLTTRYPSSLVLAPLTTIHSHNNSLSQPFTFSRLNPVVPHGRRMRGDLRAPPSSGNVKGEACRGGASIHNLFVQSHASGSRVWCGGWGFGFRVGGFGFRVLGFGIHGYLFVQNGVRSLLLRVDACTHPSPHGWLRVESLV